MASQGERVPGGLDMCSNLESMARDGTSFYNFNPRGSSPSYSEHRLCRQTESRNGGAIAPRRGTEQAAIYSAANGTTRGEHSQQQFQTIRHVPWQAWQDDYASIGRLQAQLGDVFKKVKRYEDYIEEVQSGVDESQRHADELQQNYVYGGDTAIGRFTGTNSVAKT